jgi:hypothetical protein
MAVTLYMGDYLVTVSAGERPGNLRYLPRVCSLTVDARALPSRLPTITCGPLAGQRIDIWL